MNKNFIYTVLNHRDLTLKVAKSKGSCPLCGLILRQQPEGMIYPNILDKQSFKNRSKKMTKYFLEKLLMNVFQEKRNESRRKEWEASSNSEQKY